jgi:hypothetical protein
MKNFYERYGYYREYIEKIGNAHLQKTLRIKDLGLSRGAIQMAYKEMKEESFRGKIIDYLVWIGGMFMLTLWWERAQSYKVYRKVDGNDIMRELLNERPSDAIVLVRAELSLTIKNLEQIAPGKSDEFYGGALRMPFSGPLGEVGMAAIQLDEMDMPENWGREPAKTNYPSLIKHYLRIQSVTPGLRPSLVPTTKKIEPPPEPELPQPPPTQPQPLYHHDGEAPSGADNKAKRSEASSQKAPAGAAKKSRRTTRPDSTPPLHRSGDTDAQPKSTRNSLK